MTFAVWTLSVCGVAGIIWNMIIAIRKGDVILGNWKYFAIGDRRRFTFDVSKHYAFIQNRTTIRCTGRVDSIPMIPEAFVLLSDVEGES